MPLPNVTTGDSIIVSLLLCALVLVGLRSSWKTKRDVKGYFLAGRHLPWPVIGLSLVGADAFTMIAGNAAGTAPAWMLTVEGLGALFLLLVGWLFLRRCSLAEIETAPEYLAQRFDRRSRLLVSVSSLFISVAVRIALTVVIGAMLLARVTGGEAPGLVTAAVMVAGLLALAGGFRPVVAVQGLCAVIVILAWAGAPLLISPADPIMEAAAGVVSPMTGLTSFAYPSSFPWIGAVVTLPMLVIWYWGTDQYMVQHLLAARDEGHARRGMRLAGAVKIVLLLGVALAALLLPEGSMHRVLSGDPGSRGLAVAGIVAAMVSSLTGAFQSSASLASLDLFRSFTPGASPKQLVLAGRLVTLAALVVAILFIPMARIVDAAHIEWFLNSLVLLASPVAAVYLLGMFWRRATARMAASILMSTGLIAVARMILSAFFDPAGVQNPLLRGFLEVPCLDGALYLLGVAALVVFLGSLGARLRPARVSRYTKIPS